MQVSGTQGGLPHAVPSLLSLALDEILLRLDALPFGALSRCGNEPRPCIAGVQCTTFKPIIYAAYIMPHRLPLPLVYRLLDTLTQRRCLSPTRLLKFAGCGIESLELRGGGW